MEDKRTIIDLTHTHELPYVQNKKQSNQYSRKPSNKIKKGHAQLNNHNQCERIRAQYMKLCKQIKYVYGASSVGKALKNLREMNFNYRIQTEVSIPNANKLVIKEGPEGKLCLQNKPGSVKSATQPSEEDNKFNGHFISVIQQLRINGRSSKQTFSPLFRSGLKNIKRTKPITNFIIKKLDTDYLNVQKIKIQTKTKQISSRKELFHENRSQSMINHIVMKTEESQESRALKNKFKIDNQEQIFPIITSYSKIHSNKKNHHRNSQNENIIVSGSNLLHPQVPIPIPINSVNSKPRSLRSSSNGQNSYTVMKRTKPFSPPFQTYFYRDLIWKVNFTNSMIIDTPLQYQHRLRVYIGKGNNGGLIRGLIKRRIWFAITEKIEDANFVWTQIKYIPYFNLQKYQNNKSINQQINKNNDQIKQLGLLTEKQGALFKIYFSNNCNIEQRTDQRFQFRNKYFISLNTTIKEEKQVGEEMEENPQKKQKSFINNYLRTVSQIKEQKMQNHLINNYIIGNKKALFKTMALYYKKKDDYVFNYLPYTFHIEKGLDDENYFKFLRFYYQRNKQLKAINKNDEPATWIIKPGQFSNRGNGIKVCKTIDEIKAILKTKQKYADGTERTYIVQAYLQKPLLYNKRKFDLRHYMMITCVNGILKGYWYREGYVRTSSSEYTLATNDCSIHLTNDAVQKNMPDYGKYEKGNKISYQQLHIYLQKLYGYKNFNFKEIILPKMKKITTDIVRACSGSIDPELHSNNFQIFGLDFMIDADFNLWLIQVNTNPCLELSCPLLGSIIPKMVQNALQLTLDAVYPPPVRYNPKGIHYLKKLQEQNKFDLIYDSRINGIFNDTDNAIDARLLNEEQETYEDEGEEWNED